MGGMEELGRSNSSGFASGSGHHGGSGGHGGGYMRPSPLEDENADLDFVVGGVHQQPQMQQYAWNGVSPVGATMRGYVPPAGGAPNAAGSNMHEVERVGGQSLKLPKRVKRLG